MKSLPRHGLVLAQKIWIPISLVQTLLKSETEQKVSKEEQSANSSDQRDFTTRPISNGAVRNFIANN